MVYLPLFDGARNWATLGVIHYLEIFFRREAASSNDTDDLPEEVQIIYESVTDRLTSLEPPGDISNEEAGYLAKDILYMADVVRSHLKSLKK